MIAIALASIAKLMTGAAAEWQCDPRSGAPRIYFANHSSHLDFVVVWSTLPAALRQRTRPVAGSDYWERTAVRRYLAAQVFHAVLIQRSTNRGADSSHAEASVHRMAAELDRGHSLIVFPEGTRRSDGAIGSFKSGLFHLSQLRPGVELIPVYLENLNRILPKGEVLPVPMLARVVFGPQLPRNDGEDKTIFLARAREALVALRVAS